jgi:hypothetical protein
MAAVKSAPLRNRDRARATAAYEHDEDAIPRAVALRSDFAERSGRRRVISLLETAAWTIPERANPRIRAHRISQNMEKLRLSACSIGPTHRV